MPTIKSAKKAMRQSEKNRIRNYKVRRSVKETMKKFLELAKEKKLDEIKNALPKTFSIIDKAVKVHVLHKNNAARKKARLSAILAKLEKK